MPAFAKLVVGFIHPPRIEVEVVWIDLVHSNRFADFGIPSRYVEIRDTLIMLRVVIPQPDSAEIIFS